MEVDGRYWHSKPGIEEKDEVKNFILWNFGWKLFRIEAEKVASEKLCLISEIVCNELDCEPVGDCIDMDHLVDWYSPGKTYARY